jgi:hypothetical protein
MLKNRKSWCCKQVFLYQIWVAIGGSGHCSEINLGLKLLGPDLDLSLLTGGCYLEVVVNTYLTVYDKLRNRYTIVGLYSIMELLYD